ncbi:MAG TPA: SUMF1/EgtB/PvdO family nonheme iron enzyme, partial [Polyangiaceae bacterium]
MLLGCGQILGVSDWVVDGDASTADVQNDGAPPGDAGVCTSPKAGGLDGVLVQNEFCIDKTETPVALYDTFMNDLATDPSKGQAPECGWNTSSDSYVPSFDPYASDPQRAQRPISYVDWCDAVAFCKYWGKHLCGARGDGGPLALD